MWYIPAEIIVSPGADCYLVLRFACFSLSKRRKHEVGSNPCTRGFCVGRSHKDVPASNDVAVYYMEAGHQPLSFLYSSLDPL